MTKNRRMTILVVLFLAVLAWRIFEGMSDETSPTLTPTTLFSSNEPTSRQERALSVIQALPSLDFSPPGAAAVAAEDQRNPFQFGVDRALEAKRQAEMQAVMQRLEQAPAIEVEPEPELPPEPEFEGKLFGLLYDQASSQSKAAIFLDEQVFLVAPGESFFDHYQLESINQFEVVIRDNRNQKSLTLVLETETMISWP